MTDTCPDHSESEPPWMCACTRNTLDASRRMVEMRDIIIKDLERQIEEVKTDREFVRGWAVRCQNEMDHQASLADIARTEIRELNAMLHGVPDPS